MINRRYRNLSIRKKMLIAFCSIFGMAVLIMTIAVITLFSTRVNSLSSIDAMHQKLEDVLINAGLDEQLVDAGYAVIHSVVDEAYVNTEKQITRFIIYLIVFAAVTNIISVYLALYVSKTISGPVAELSDAAHEVANGNLDVDLNVYSYDEIGILTSNFKRVVKNTRMLVDDLGRIDRAFRIDGDTTGRVDIRNYIGAYSKMAKEINDILDYHVISKKEILECITKIVGGDHDAPLRQFPGEEASINSAVDYLRVSIRALEQVMKQKAEAETANQAKSSFLANMSHEIRTPMNSILGVTEMLMDTEGLPENIEQGLITIYNSSNLLLGIINDILDFSKIEAGKLDIIPVQYEVASMINDSTQLNMMRIESRAIKFELHINENVPARLLGDELRIKEILNNLLSNAIKYTKEGKVILSVDFSADYEYQMALRTQENTAGSEEPGINENTAVSETSDANTTDANTSESSGTGTFLQRGILILKVSDTGFGMTQEQVEGLFTEYSRYNQQSHTIEGTGLGLAITKRLVDLMNGDIHVESSHGIGSTFTVRLPQVIADDEVIGSETAENLRKFRLNYITDTKRPQTIRDPMPYGRVLIVDDVEPNLYVAEGIMRLYKLQTDTAMSGYEAIEKIKDGNVYDVIFLDHMMPGMDGIETAAKMREIGYSEPIVALTANAVAGQTEIMASKGFDDFISKPIDTRRLNTVLNRLVRDKQPQEVIDAARKQAEEARHKNGNSSEAGRSSALARFSKTLSEDVYGLDVEKGLKKFEGDEQAYIKTLRAYASHIKEMLDSIKNVNKIDINNYRITVHGIKGASYDIFANTAGMMAESLEKSARANDIDYITVSNATFIYTVRKLIANIEEMLESIDALDPKIIKKKPDDEVLLKLLGACRRVSMDGVDEAMEEIDSFTYDGDDGLVDWLRNSAEKLKFKEIVEKLTQMGYK